MILWLITLLGYVTLSAWAYFDEKFGKVGLLWMIIPIGAIFAAGFPDSLVYGYLLIPFFGLWGMGALFPKIKFGMADVLGLPLGIWLSYSLGVWALVSFSLLLAGFFFAFSRLPGALRGPDKTIRFIPIVLYAYFGAVCSFIMGQWWP